jgi:hypothetical protein
MLITSRTPTIHLRHLLIFRAYSQLPPAPSINPSISAALKAATAPKKSKNPGAERGKEKKQKRVRTEGEVLADLEKLLAAQRRRPDIDIWAQPIETMGA